ncbi:MAG TPA: hypothetical protein VGM56_26585, partial [Byssovorax sp.]
MTFVPDDDHRHFQDAFEQTANERAALASDDLLPLNLDVLASAAVVLGAAPRVAKLHGELRQ